MCVECVGFGLSLIIMGPSQQTNERERDEQEEEEEEADLRARVEGAERRRRQQQGGAHDGGAERQRRPLGRAGRRALLVVDGRRVAGARLRSHLDGAALLLLLLLLAPGCARCRLALARPQHLHAPLCAHRLEGALHGNLALELASSALVHCAQHRRALV